MSRKQRIKACDSKVRYQTITQAWAAAKSYQHRFHANNVRPYVCRYCGGWHIGHSHQPTNARPN